MPEVVHRDETTVLQSPHGDTMASSYQLDQKLQRDTMSSRGQLNLDVGDQKHSRFLPLDEGYIDCMEDEGRFVVSDLEQSNAINQHTTLGKLIFQSQHRVAHFDEVQTSNHVDRDKNMTRAGLRGYTSVITVQLQHLRFGRKVSIQIINTKCLLNINSQMRQYWTKKYHGNLIMEKQQKLSRTTSGMTSVIAHILQRNGR